MDAKPQRPSRPLASQPAGIENYGQLPGQPAAHQRQKSVGNLKNMASTGGLRVTAKRAAFGELSNIINAVKQPDDAKWKGVSKPQLVSVIHDKENVMGWHDGSFNQPAQRPPKSTSNVAVSNNLPVARSASDEGELAINDFILPEYRAPVAKQTTQKKTTFVYQDFPARESKTQPAGDAVLDEQAKNPRRYKSHPQLAFEHVPQQKSDQQITKEVGNLASFDDNVSEAPYEDAVEHFVNPSELLKTRVPELPARGTEPSDTNHHLSGEMTPSSHPEEVLPLPATSEPEEYWDEYEEDDLYDEQGYTTAHSYRSHGDTTSGGATTLVVPKITTKIQKELDAAKAHVDATRCPQDIEEESWDISMVAEYGDEIFSYMKELEGRMLPNAHYMDIQTEIQWSMRSVLMDWLIQVHNRFNLLPETLFLAVNYIDRFLSTKIVSLGKLQLVGATAIFIAAKYEEINCPSIQEILFMVDGGYSADEILKAERFMLSMLSFELGWPGPMSFLRRVSKADEYDLETRTLAKYFLEVTIMDERFVGSPPSFLAAGAHCLARLMLKKGDWSPAHVHYSGYTWAQLKSLVALILECCQFPAKHHAVVHEKYSDSKYKRASLFVESEVERGFVVPFQQAPRTSNVGAADEDAALLDCIAREMGHLIPIEG